MSDEEEEYDVFAISRTAGDKPSQRTPQTSHFGAVDENVNLEFNANEDGGGDEGVTSDESYQGGAPPATDSENREDPQEGVVEGTLCSLQVAEVADRLITGKRQI